MHPTLSRNLFLVKEKVGLLKASNNYDIFDPATGQKIMECRENIGLITKIFRFTDYKTMTPFRIELFAADGSKVLTVRRGITFFLSNVEVLDEHDQVVGRFKQQFFSIGGKFRILDAQDQFLCTLKGKWTGWDFKFVSEDGHEFGSVTKKWAGIGRELFTSADNYVLAISDQVPTDNRLRLLILAAVMCIDMVLKE